MERNKLNPKEKLLHTVGTILAKEGFGALSANKVARESEVDKRQMYRLFGSFENLMDEFLKQRDYWMNIVDRTNKTVTDNSKYKLLELINFFLEKQLDTFTQDKVLQQITLWGISDPESPLMAKLFEGREKVGSAVFEKTDVLVGYSPVNYRTITALLVAGINHLSLHAAANKGTFCEIDLRDELGQAESKRAIRLINGWAFDAANGKQ